MEQIYRCYITDILRASVHWNVQPNRYAEIIGLVPADDRTGEEIAADVIRKHGLREKET